MPGREAEERRRRRERATGHPVRAAILSQLQDGRALPATALAQELPGSPGLSTVVYHLAVLADAELVKSAGEPGRRVFSLA